MTLALIASLLTVCTNGTEIVFGNQDVSVALDRKDLSVKAFRTDGETVLKPLPEYPVTLATCCQDASWQKEPKCEMFGEGVFRVNDSTIRLVNRCGNWRVETFLSLFPEKRRVCRRYALEWLMDEPGKLTTFWVNHGTVDGGGFLLPRMFPPVEKEASACRSGNPLHRLCNLSPSVVVAEDGRGHGFFVCTDETRPYADRVNSLVRERNRAFSVSTAFLSTGHVRRGIKQLIGDVWIQFVKGGRAEALAAVPDWFSDLGLRPPADTPDWMRRLVLYSTHPRGPVEYGSNERVGFLGKMKFLPQIAALGANCVWLRPLTDHPEGMGTYNPRDYYKLADEVGTPDDFRRYVKTAHGLGLRVWHDAVVHGGRSDTPRAMEHPEWVGWQADGKKLDYWCFDQNWPSWAEYIGRYIEHYTREYSLDGWREDVPTGARHANWNPDIPYARASFAQNQGGFLQQRTIRAATRKINPDAATLAETHLGFYSTVSDAIYDVKLCHEVFPEMRLMPPEKSAALLMRRFQEHRQVCVPGSIWMRYVESHDSLRAEMLYGRAGANALMALCAWVDGFPLVLEEGEYGAFEAWREIFRIRRAVPALTGSAADYVSVKPPEGVFACLRGSGRNRVVVLVNFLGRRVQGRVAGGGCDFVCDLPPLGYGVFQPSGKAVPAAVRKEEPFEGLAGDPAAQADWSVFTNAARQLVIRMPKATRWFANAADGTSGGPLRNYHPDYDPKAAIRYPIYNRKLDSTCRWMSPLHPFGLKAIHASVGGCWENGAVVVAGFRASDDVRIYERDEGVYGLTIVCPADAPVRIAKGPAVRTPPVGTGDDRLQPLIGGWRWESGGVRVDLANNGSLIAASRKDGKAWRPLAARGGFVLDTKREAKKRFMDQFSAVDATERIEKTPEGGVKLTFDGPMRNLSRDVGRLSKPVSFHTVVTCHPNGSVDYATDFTVARNYKSNEAELAWKADLLDSSLEPEWVGSSHPLRESREEGAKFDWFADKPFRDVPANRACGLVFRIRAER